MDSFGLFEAFLAFFCFLIFSYFLNKQPFDYLRLKKAFQSYPWNWPVLGMLPGLIARIHQIDESVKILEKYNMTFLFKAPWFTGMDTLITVDPANIHHIMSSNFSNFVRDQEFRKTFKFFGEGTINSDGERGSMMNKCYQLLLHHHQGFQRFAMSTTRSKLKDVLLPLFNHFAEEGIVVDLQDVFRRFMFDTTLVTITGCDPRSLSVEMRENEVSKAFEDVEEAIVYRHCWTQIQHPGNWADDKAHQQKSTKCQEPDET